jgi:hypothetical protein
MLELGPVSHLIHMDPTGGKTAILGITSLTLLTLAVRLLELHLKLFKICRIILIPGLSPLNLDASLVLLECWHALPPVQHLQSATDNDGGSLGLEADRFAGDLDGVG